MRAVRGNDPYLGDGGYSVKTTSLPTAPSVPGPVYFDDGWKKVTNPPKMLISKTTFTPEGNAYLLATVLSLL